MSDESSLSDSELIQARDLGAITYLSAYVHLLARQLGVDDSNKEAINAMVVQMVDPLNFATQAAWCGLMHDQSGMDQALKRLRDALEEL